MAAQDQIILKIFIIWSLWTIIFMFIHVDARNVIAVDSKPYRKLIASKMKFNCIYQIYQSNAVNYTCNSVLLEIADFIFYSEKWNFEKEIYRMSHINVCSWVRIQYTFSDSLSHFNFLICLPKKMNGHFWSSLIWPDYVYKLFWRQKLW